MSPGLVFHKLFQVLGRKNTARVLAECRIFQIGVTRFQKRVIVFIYGHTPDSLVCFLTGVKQLCGQRIVVAEKSGLLPAESGGHGSRQRGDINEACRRKS